MTAPGRPSLDELAAEVAELRDRIGAIESTPRGAAPRLSVAELVPALRELLPDEGSPPDGVVVYAGLGPRGESEVAWQMGRRWQDVLAADRTRSSRSLAALASPARLDIVGELLAGPLSRQELQDRLDQSTAGQLNHHLRELLSAGLVDQPKRGVYQVPVHHVIPVLTLLCCAADVAAGSVEPEA